MSKLTLDQLFQQKLNQLEVPHKPEYWTQMEEELETAAPVGVGGIGASLSKIYLISGITTSLVVISFVTYFAFKGKQSNNINTQTISTSITESTSTENQKNNSTTKQNVVFESDCGESNNSKNSKEVITKTSTIAKHKQKPASKTKVISRNVSTASINKTVETNKESTSYGSYLKKRQESKDNNAIIVADKIQLNSTNKLFEYNSKSLIRTIYDNNSASVKETNINNELIVIKPIHKPAKKVFKRRKGILYRLGIRN
jgi:hypothetical protein